MHSTTLSLVLLTSLASVAQARGHPHPGHIYTPKHVEEFSVVCENKYVDHSGIQYYYKSDAAAASPQVSAVQNLINGMGDCQAAVTPREGQEKCDFDWPWTGVLVNAAKTYYIYVPCNETRFFTTMRCCPTFSLFARKDESGKWTTGDCRPY